MAELLVMFSDQQQAQAMPWKALSRGMAVEARLDGAEYGRLERPPTFMILQIPGAPKSTFDFLLTEPTALIINPRTRRKVPSRPRNAKLDLDKLLGLREPTATHPALTITLTELHDAVVDLVQDVRI